MSEKAINPPADDSPTLWRHPFRYLRLQGRLAIAIGVVLLLIIGIAWIIQHGKNIQVGDANRRFRLNNAVAVAVGTASIGDIPLKLPALGTVTPLATVTVKPQISGLLQQIVFKEGQIVRQGDFLAQIDPRPYQAALDQAEGNLRRDQALLTNAILDQKRYVKLVAEDSIASQQVDTQAALVKQYEGTVAGDEAAVKTAQVNLAYSHIVSPVSGRVGLRQVDQGNYVTPGDANGIVVVTQLQPISVIFPIPEDNLPVIQKRMAAGATLQVDAFDRTNTNKLASGKLLTLDNQIDTTTGTVKIRALFDNKDGVLFANQFVNVQLLEDTLQNQVIMPIAAVQHGAPNGVNSTFVYLVTMTSVASAEGGGGAFGMGSSSGARGSAGATGSVGATGSAGTTGSAGAIGSGGPRGAIGTVSVHPITLGTVDGERVAVTSGLSAGDVVVTEGGDRLRDGATVQMPAATAAQDSGAAGARKGRGRRPGGFGGPPGGPPAGPP